MTALGSSDASNRLAMKLHIKKGDEVVVLAGAEKGKRGKIIVVNPQKGRVIVEGLKMIKRHTRKSQERPQGAIVEREGSIHLSNVMKVAKFDARAARRGPAPAAASAGE
jgi:large subunit ribosomal protein L24